MPQAKFQINHYQKFKLAAIFSCAAVFIGGVYFFQPFSLSEDTNATTETTQNGDYYIETTTTDLNLSINTTPAGAQETASHDVIVKTDDPAGFTLTVSVNNDTSHPFNLVGSTSATEKFNATSGTYASPKALDDNTWGFADTLTKKNNDQWAAVPLLSNAQQLKQTSSASPSGDTTTVHYGIKAKYDGTHSNGNYSNIITYSVVGNTPPVEYMQDFTTTKCNALTQWTGSTAGDTVTLVDKRDNNEYQVRKLADGNCWMSQNLKLSAESLTTAGHSTTLNSSDTDITDPFTVPTSAEWTTWDGTNAHIIRAQDAPIGSIDGPTADSDLAAKRGTYYNWAAAVATEGITNTTSTTYTTSICPKGWKLPTGDGTIVGTSTATTNQFTTLYAAYDNNKSNMDRALHYYNNSDSSATYAGHWHPGSAYLTNSGTDMLYWSSTTSTTAGHAWYLSEDSSGGIGTAYSNARGFGFSVRCVLSAE